MPEGTHDGLLNTAEAQGYLREPILRIFVEPSTQIFVPRAAQVPKRKLLEISTALPLVRATIFF